MSAFWKWRDTWESAWPRNFIPLRTKQYYAAHGTNIETTDKIGLRRVQSQTCLSYAEPTVAVGGEAEVSNTMVNFGEANGLRAKLTETLEKNI